MSARPSTAMGDQSLDYIFVDDTIDALLANGVARTRRQGLNVASGRALTVNDLTTLMLGVAGSDLEPKPVRPTGRPGRPRVGDPSLARDELGWVATTPAEVGLARVWRWMNRDDRG